MTKIRLMDIVSDISRVDSYLKNIRDLIFQIDPLHTKNIQKVGISVVNDTLNDLYVKYKEYEGFRIFIDKFKIFNMITLV